MHKNTYLKYLNNLKDELINYKIGTDTYSIGDLGFVFNRDNEGFYEENELTVYDYFSKRTITTYFINEQYCRVSISPFMKLAGCGSLVPDIIGEINLGNTFEKLLKYVRCNNKSINLYYSQSKKQAYYIGTTHATKDFKINGLDPTNHSHYKIIKDILGEQLECGEFVGWYNDKEYKFEFGTNPFKALDADKTLFNNKDNDNTIFYPEINIKFTNYEDIKQKLNIIKEKLDCLK